MADHPSVKITISQGVSIIRGEISLHELVWALLRDPAHPVAETPLMICCLVRNAPIEASELSVEVLCPDGDGVDCVGSSAAPLFPTAVPGYSVALATIPILRLPVSGTYTVTVICRGIVLGQEPLPVLDIAENEP